MTQQNGEEYFRWFKQATDAKRTSGPAITHRGLRFLNALKDILIQHLEVDKR